MWTVPDDLVDVEQCALDYVLTHGPFRGLPIGRAYCLYHEKVAPDSPQNRGDVIDTRDGLVRRYSQAEGRAEGLSLLLDKRGEGWMGWSVSHQYASTSQRPDVIALAKFFVRNRRTARFYQDKQYLTWAALPLPDLGTVLVDDHACPECGRRLDPLYLKVQAERAEYMVDFVFSGPPAWASFWCRACEHSYAIFK